MTRPRARCLSVQGTTSHAGKSLVVTALCRWLHRAGVRVAPFKAMNMALNAAVCADGSEIGRAQAVQAEAAGIAPTADLNPILVKPEGGDRAAWIVRGRPAGPAPDGALLRAAVADSLRRLRAAYDVVVLEGAGSPAEPNLQDRDLANMHAAALAEAPVLVVGDIDRGGCFAHFVGTLACLPDDARARVAGWIVNKFRGERARLDGALGWLAERTGRPVLGVLPWLAEPGLPAEDAVDLDRGFGGRAERADTLDVAVVALPGLSNLDDFDALGREPGVLVRLAHVPTHCRGADLVILPGTKCTTADLEWVRRTGFDRALAARTAAGEPVLGICGGCQMLGGAIADPEHLEGTDAEGLGWLPLHTRFGRPKVTARRVLIADDATFLTRGAAGTRVEGYVIHAGRTSIPDHVLAVASGDGTVVGTMWHGLLENRAIRQSLCDHLRARRGWPSVPMTEHPRAAAYDRLVDLLRAHADLAAIGELVGVGAS